MLQKRSELEKIPYVLLQLNPEKKVEYSSEKTFAKGDILELDEDGRIEQNGYEGVAKRISMDFIRFCCFQLMNTRAKFINGPC